VHSYYCFKYENCKEVPFSVVGNTNENTPFAVSILNQNYA